MRGGEKVCGKSCEGKLGENVCFTLKGVSRDHQGVLSRGGDLAQVLCGGVLGQKLSIAARRRVKIKGTMRQRLGGTIVCLLDFFSREETIIL